MASQRLKEEELLSVFRSLAHTSCKEIDMQAGESKTTTDHALIRKWAEERGGVPASVSGTGGGDDAGILRIEFPGYGSDENLEEIAWEEFFEKFEQNGLAFLYQEHTKDGSVSRFFKFVRRDG
jgi:hypothetical protein